MLNEDRYNSYEVISADDVPVVTEKHVIEASSIDLPTEPSHMVFNSTPALHLVTPRSSNLLDESCSGLVSVDGRLKSDSVSADLGSDQPQIRLGGVNGDLHEIVSRSTSIEDCVAAELAEDSSDLYLSETGHKDIGQNISRSLCSSNDRIEGPRKDSIVINHSGESGGGRLEGIERSIDVQQKYEDISSEDLLKRSLGSCSVGSGHSLVKATTHQQDPSAIASSNVDQGLDHVDIDCDEHGDIEEIRKRDSMTNKTSVTESSLERGETCPAGQPAWVNEILQQQNPTHFSRELELTGSNLTIENPVVENPPCADAEFNKGYLPGLPYSGTQIQIHSEDAEFKNWEFGMRRVDGKIGDLHDEAHSTEGNARIIGNQFSAPGGSLSASRSFLDKKFEEREISTCTRPESWPPSVETTMKMIIGMSCFHLAYGFIFGSMGLCVLPLEAVHLSPQSTSIAQGIMLGICGVSQLICPIVGKVSDLFRSDTVYGRRSPLIKLGCCLSTIGVIGMYYSSKFLLSFICYNVSLFIGMLGLNTIYSVQGGLAPDLLVELNIDQFSACVASMGLIGSSLGFCLIMVTTHVDYHKVYPLYVILVLITVFITHRICMTLQNSMVSQGRIRGNPLDSAFLYSNNHAIESTNGRGGSVASRWDWPVCPWVYGECTWRSLSESFIIDTSKNKDFFWVFWSRTFYYIGVSVQTFVQPFLRDVAKIADESEQRFKLASVALTAQSVAAFVAIMIGRRIKNTDTSKRALIYLAASCMCFVYIAFALVPLMNPYGFQWLMFISPLYGFGNGCFLSVDYAIAIAVIEKSQAAQMLGVWGVSSFIGAAIGPMIFGFLIEVFGGDLIAKIMTGSIGDLMNSASTGGVVEAYSYSGYFSMLMAGCASTAVAGLLISKIQTRL
eukprot:GHVH01013973.1.p1 GENE.GHVH01013973.1~~GHVH01013973.1.p1  ORF type:complete len:899 (-),score=117.46 GHVH01013973.1:98-2794(-)